MFFCKPKTSGQLREVGGVEKEGRGPKMTQTVFVSRSTTAGVQEERQEDVESCALPQAGAQ